MGEPICKIARENGGHVPLECAFHCLRGCHDEIRHDTSKGVTCLRCSATGLYWQDTWDATGQRRPKLYEGGKPHVCRPTADDFEDLT